MKKLLTFLLSLLMLIPVVSCGSVSEGEVSEAAAVVSSAALHNLATSSKTSVTATDDAYVRGGTHGTKCYSDEKRSSGELEIKADIPDYTREVLIKFEISELDLAKAQSVYLYVNFVTGGGGAKSGNDLYLYVYEVAGNWDSKTVTYDTAPAYDINNKAGIASVPREGGVCSIDVSSAVFDAVSDGKTEIAFRLALSEQTVSQGVISSVSCETTYVRPKLMVRNSDSGCNYEKMLLSDNAANDALWAYAEELYDSWYGRYQEILKKGDYDYESVVTNSDEYNLKVSARGGNGSSKYYTFDTRLMSDLKGYEETVYDVDRYGGALSAEKQEATGYYYTKKIGDRWWVVDPLGNLMHIHGTSHFKYAYISTSEAQKIAALRVFGTYEKWAIAATRWAMDDLYINVAHTVADEARDVELAMPITGSFSGINAYSTSVGAIIPNGGGVPQFAGGAMPVFDPAFVDYVDASVKYRAELYADRTDIIGYISDNEVLMSDKMLESYLSLDYTEPVFMYSYVAAWTWYKNITGEENPAIEDIDKYCEKLGLDLWDLFKGFVYDRYYKVCAETLDKYDPNRMYMGNRYLIGCDKWEWIMRFTGYWCDIMCINYYHVWEIPTSRETKEGSPTLDQLGAWLGIPFVVTEFYSKGNDSFDANGVPMNNNGGAGWVVATQKERGYFYQNFCLKLLQCKYNVGWFQFQFIDNDPTDPIGSPAAAQSANKGIVDWNQDFEIYSDFTDQLAKINKNTYALIEYFDGVNYVK